jgi:hypothetical protein
MHHLPIELTDQGEQILAPSVQPITNQDRLRLRGQMPLLPRCRQKPLDIGLWDMNSRNQLELFGKTHPD